MILPIYGYGQKVLLKKCKEVKEDFEELAPLIENMFDTMYNAEGVGLAAPQIGISKKLFIVDTVQLKDRDGEVGVKQVFINPVIVNIEGDPTIYEEGCLSIPAIRGDVERPPKIHLKYRDESFEEQNATFSGVNARVIQHEYDHLEGVLFTEKLKPIKKRLIRRKLVNLQKGNAGDVSYPMKFAER